MWFWRMGRIPKDLVMQVKSWIRFQFPQKRVDQQVENDLIDVGFLFSLHTTAYRLEYRRSNIFTLTMPPIPHCPPSWADTGHHGWPAACSPTHFGTCHESFSLRQGKTDNEFDACNWCAPMMQGIPLQICLLLMHRRRVHISIRC